MREALANAIVHGNHEDPRKHVHVTCRCKPDEVSIAVKDEGQGFDINKIEDPTSPENVGDVYGRGIYLMKAFMDEVRFEQGGAVVRIRKKATQIAAKNARKNSREQVSSAHDSKFTREHLEREDLRASTTSEILVTERHILLVGPYGVLGTHPLMLPLALPQGLQ